MPYILNDDGDIKIVVEEVKIFPYELSEVSAYGEKNFGVNNVLIVSLDEFITAEEKQENVPWVKLFSCNEGDRGYVRVLTTLRSILIIAFVDNTNKCSRIQWINSENGYVVKDVVLPCRITEVLQEKNVITAYISWNVNSIAVYNTEGNLICEISTDEFNGGNENLEINRIIAVVDGTIVFDAKDYGDDKDTQVRVLYDVPGEKYVLYHSPFVIYRKQNVL